MCVNITRLNAQKMLVQSADFDFIIKAREFFKFHPERYQFMPTYKSGFWDGYINMLELDGTMSCGLLQEMINFSKINNKQVNIDPAFNNYKIPVSRQALEGAISKLDLPFEPYEYQVDGLLYALNNGRSLLESCTSSGKSIMIYMYIRMIQFLNPNYKFILVVPTAGLVVQMFNDFKSYETTGNWTQNNCYMVKGKVKQMDDKPITITTFQAMNNAKTKPPKTFFHQFDVLIVDEVHRAESESMLRIVTNCVNANYRLGVTGSFKESKTHLMQLKGLFGETKVVITTHELIDLGRAAQITIHCAMLQYPKHQKKELRLFKEVESNGKVKKVKASYSEEIDYITKHNGRAKLVCDLAARLKGNTIVMVSLKEHGRIISQMLRKNLPNRIIYDYNGEVKVKEREEIRQLTEINDGVIIVGSLQTISTGISIKKLDNLIFAHPVKSKIYTLQSIGRLLRMCKDSDNLVDMYDLIDDFTEGKYTNYAYEHAKERVRYYDESQLNYNIIQIPMDMYC